MEKNKKRVPIYIDRDFRTKYIQDPKTGLMKGRKRVKGFGDRTAVRRVDGVKKEEIIGYIKTKKGKTYRTGNIVGRVPRHRRRNKKTGKKYPVREHKRKIKK